MEEPPSTRGLTDATYRPTSSPVSRPPATIWCLTSPAIFSEPRVPAPAAHDAPLGPPASLARLSDGNLDAKVNTVTSPHDLRRPHTVEASMSRHPLIHRTAGQSTHSASVRTARTRLFVVDVDRKKRIDDSARGLTPGTLPRC